MKASERLRALDEAMTAGPWRGLIPNAEYATHGEFNARTEASLVALRNALPKLIAVVEAVQEAVAILGPRVEQPCSCEGCDCENAMANAVLTPALDALAAKLNPEEGA